MVMEYVVEVYGVQVNCAVSGLSPPLTLHQHSLLSAAPRLIMYFPFAGVLQLQPSGRSAQSAVAQSADAGTGLGEAGRRLTA